MWFTALQEVKKKKKKAGFKAAHNVGRETDLALSLFHPLPNFPVHLFPTFFRRLYKSGWCCCWRGDRPYIKNSIRLSQGSDGLTAGSFKWIHPSLLLFLLLFFLLCVPSARHCSSHTYNSSSWSDGEPDGFFSCGFTAFLWWQRQGQDKVTFSIIKILAPLIVLYRQRKILVSHKHIKVLKHFLRVR